MNFSIILILLVFSIMLIPPTYAITFEQRESEMITLSTDKKYYNFSEDVLVTITNNHPQEVKLKLTIIGLGYPLKTIILDSNDSFEYIMGSEFFDRFFTGKIVLFQLRHDHNYESINSSHVVETDIHYGLETLKTITDSEYSKNVMFTIDKTSYSPNDEIIVIGSAPKEYVWNNIGTQIHDPKGNIVSGGSAIVDKDGFFNYTIQIRNFEVNGEYLVKLRIPHTNQTLVTNFQYHDPEIIDIVALDQDVKDLRTDVDSLQLQFDNFQKFVNEQFNVIMNMLGVISN